MDVSLFANQTINAFTLGGIYALIAVGYTMVYGIIKLINFAHGEIYMMGAFIGILLIARGVPFVGALALAMLLCAGLGVAIDVIAYRPLRNAPRLAPLITAIGVSLFLQNFVMLLWGASERPFPDLRPAFLVRPIGAEALARGDELLSGIEGRLQSSAFGRLKHVERRGDELYVAFRLGTESNDTRSLLRDARRDALAQMRATEPTINLDAEEVGLEHWLNRPAWSIHLGGDRAVELKWKVVFIWIVAIALMLTLEAVVQQTKMGKAMRACALDKATAALMGIDVNKIIAATFAIGSALAATAGVLFALYRGSGIGYRMGFQPGVFAFSAAVLGGIGNIRGAMLGGVVLGVVQVAANAYITGWLGVSSNYEFAFAFGLLILVILIRPTGLLGRASAERA